MANHTGPHQGPPGSGSLSPDDYTVGWICALPVEMAAARIMLDVEHPKLPTPATDTNTYALGEISGHNIVIACLPSGVYGTTSAAVVATQMLSTFPSIRFGLMVGIGGGVPGRDLDIRLGDVVVSKPTERHGGVVQYDYGKTIQGGFFERSGMLNKPPTVLLTGIASLETETMLRPDLIPSYLHDRMARFEQIGGFLYPGTHEDYLYEAEYDHPDEKGTCDSCDKQRRVRRHPRATYHPNVHYGVIASGNQVMKHGITRDRLADELGVVCFEMEAAGLMDNFPCLVIRGISDYADSHKNKQWQGYSAATAAAYAKALLSVMPVDMIKKTDKAADIFQREKFRVSLDIRDLPITSCFIGRESEMLQLWNMLAPEVSTLRKVAIIHGMGGIGKTQLAIQYARAHKDTYTATFWLNAKDQEHLVQSLAGFALKLASLELMSITPGTEEDYESMAKQMLAWLAIEQNSGWLLIFDNVEQNASASDQENSSRFDIRKFFPSADHGSIILTTRHPQWAEIGSPCPLYKLEMSAANQLLMLCSGARVTEEIHEERSSSSTIDPHITKLLARLDGLPLAIVITGSFISRTGMGFAKYLQHYEVSWRSLMSKAEPRSDYFNGDMLTTWTVSYREILAQNRRAARLLLLLSCFSNRDIWYELLSSAVSISDIPPWFKEVVSDEINFSTIMQILVDFSMVQAHPVQGNYSIHPVIQDWCQNGIEHIYETSQVLDEVQNIALAAVGNCIPMNTERLYWTVQHRLMPHANHLLQLFQPRWDSVKASKTLLFSVHMLGILYQDQGRISESNQMFQLALRGRESLLGADHINTLASANNLAILYRTQGKLQQAEELYMRVRESRQRTLGADHPSTVRVVLNLGNVYADQNKLAEAKQMYQQVLDYRLKVLGAEHHLTLNVYQNLGIIYRVEGKFELAKDLYQRVLAAREVTLGPHHTDTLDIVNNLGNLYLDQGKLREGEAMLLRALEGREKAIGREHTDTLGTINGLGNIYLEQGRLNEAENMYQESFTGRKDTQGMNHINTLESLKNLGNLYLKQGELAEAEKMYAQSVEGYTKVIGGDKVDSLRAMHGLANSYREQGKLEQAEALYVDIISKFSALPGDQHWSAQLVRHDLGKLLLKQRKHRKAAEMYTNALWGLVNTVGPGHISVLRVLADEGDLYANWGNLHTAHKSYLQASKGFQEQLGIDHPSTLQVIYALGTVQERQGQYAEAKDSYQLVLERRQKALGLDDSTTLQAAERLRKVESKIQWRQRGLPLLSAVIILVIALLVSVYYDKLSFS